MILVTGGAGYIGSHTTLALLEAGFDVVVLDNLSNSSTTALIRVETLSGRTLTFVEGDICDEDLLDHIFHSHKITSVLHFAGLKAVGESVQNPLAYYQNNVSGTLTLCKSMEKAGVFNLVFSSSATVYGEPLCMPISESCPTGEPTNPYGRSKLMVEKCLQDLAASESQWCIALLRYFNPIGAHKSGMLGEDPNGLPNNLLPYLSQVATKRLEELSVYGNDYPTEDGTGIRDYIHVVDLALGHIKALHKIQSNPGIYTWNLGRGEGHSVLQIISTFEKVTGKPIKYRIAPRRQGDIAESWADISKAKNELDWIANLTLEDMISDTWSWITQNPNGYQ